MSFSYLNIELYYSAIENFHTFVYIYRAVRVTAKATDLNYYFLKSFFFFFFFYEWEHRTGTICPFSSLYPSRNGKE